MAEEKKAPKAEEKKAAPKSKADVVRASKMPKWQKDACLKELSPPTEAAETVSFMVYCKVRKVRSSLIKPMLAYPKAANVEAATVQGWDEIFKNF